MSSVDFEKWQCPLSLSFKDRQGVSVHVKMQVQPFDNLNVICNAIYVSNVTRKC